MFNKTVCRIVSVFVFALFVQIGFGQYVDPQTALDRIVDEIVQVEDSIEEQENIQYTGSFQTSQQASIDDIAYLKLLKAMEEDILSMKSVEEAFDKYQALAASSDDYKKTVLNNAIAKVVTLLS